MIGNNVIITGDTVEQKDTTVVEFLALVRELREGLREAPLEAKLAERLDTQAELVEQEAESEKPNAELILGTLRTVTNVLAGAAQAGEKLVPFARRLGEMASGLF